MAGVIRVVKGIVALLVVAFAIAFIIGAYRALDATGTYTLLTSEKAGAAERSTPTAPAPASDAFDTSTGQAGHSGEASVPDTAAAAPDTSSLSAPVAGTLDVPDAGAWTSGAQEPGPDSRPAASDVPVTSTPSEPPTAAAPVRAWHPAWDEWIEEGHWETSVIPATYGQREVLGSICNDCGADVSGHAVQHLKETHHSGYHEGVVGYETYEITPERTEQVWIDTSHWVHHDGYYS
jgi:hypothetical protein